MKTTDMPNLKLIPASPEEIKSLLVTAFMEDEDLLKMYTPVQNDTLDNCVERCYDTISDMLTSPVYFGSEKQIYKIIIEEKDGRITVGTTVGFSILVINEDAPNELFSFGINIHYRSKKIVMKWLKEVQWKLGKFFWIALYKQNTRAINFFLKNQFTLQEEENRSFVMLFANHEEYINLQKQKIEN